MTKYAIGKKFMAKSSGMEPFYWSFIDYTVIADFAADDIEVIVQDAQTELDFSFGIDKQEARDNVWHNKYHGEVVLVKPAQEHLAEQWVPVAALTEFN